MCFAPFPMIFRRLDQKLCLFKIHDFPDFCPKILTEFRHSKSNENFRKTFFSKLFKCLKIDLNQVLSVRECPLNIGDASTYAQICYMIRITFCFQTLSRGKKKGPFFDLVKGFTSVFDKILVSW